jgi:hypothetical protein
VILQIIAGIVDIIFGFLLALVYAVATVIFGVGMHGFAVLVLPWSLLFFALGIFSFILAYGLWTGQGWAWTLGIILAVIGIGISVVGLFFGDYANILPIVFYIIILVYLLTYNVRVFFGRAVPYPMPYPAYPGYVQSTPQQPPPQYQQQPGYYPTPPPPQTRYRAPGPLQKGSGALQRTGMCPTCLSPVEIGAPYCPRCGSRLR